MPSAEQIAHKFIGAAQKNPTDREAIFRQAAYTFMGLAHDPKNAHSQGALAKIGLDFAQAAVREQPVVTDDFTQLLRETQQAYNETSGDTMEAIARQRQLHDEQDPARAKQIIITPESFNKDATLGRSANIKWLPTPADTLNGVLQSQNVAFWQGSKKEAQAMTVDASLGTLPPPVPAADFEVLASGLVLKLLYGEVEYGSDGNRTKVRFDLGYGRRFTVVGNYIALTLGVEASTPDNNPSTIITVGGSIGAFAAPTPAPLIRTVYVNSLATGAPPPGSNGTVIEIPLKSVMLLPVQSTLALGGTARFNFLDNTGGITYTVFYTQGAQQTPIPLTGEVSFIQVINTGAAAANFRFPFQLSM